MRWLGISDLQAQLGLKAPAWAWLSGAQALRYREPGPEPAQALNQGPAQPEAGAQGPSHSLCGTGYAVPSDN